MICPVCKAILENFEDTRYCSNCGFYIYQYQSNNRIRINSNRISNRNLNGSTTQQNTMKNNDLKKKNQNNKVKKKDNDFVAILIIVIIAQIIYHFFLS